VFDSARPAVALYLAFTDEGAEPHHRGAEASPDGLPHPWLGHPKSPFAPESASLSLLIPAKDDQPAQPFRGEKAAEDAKRDWQLPACRQSKKYHR
jgi:hypothetical protein